MRRCVGFLTAAMAVCGLTARADYLYIKIDLGQVYQNIPAMPAGLGVGVPGGKGFPMPMPPVGLPAPVKPVAASDGPFVYATIEMKSKSKFEGAKDDKGVERGGHLFDHAWGVKGRFVVTPELTPGIIKYTKITREPLAKEFDKAFKKELVGVKDPRKFLNAAAWALQHGLTKEFHATMDDLVKLDPKNAVVANYQRVQTALKKSPGGDDPALKSLIADLTQNDTVKYHPISSDSGFYTVLTNLPATFDSGIKRRANRLHETMENFYYWFALHDNLSQPALPRYRQLLVVTNSIEEFYVKHAQWGSPPFAGDGVTPRRDNFILMPWRTIDEVQRSFDANNQELWKKLQIPRDWFLTGSVWDPNKLPAARDVYQVAFTQTLTIVQKAIEDEAELATLSREGTRQLLFSSGILPRQVHTPEWIAEGLASFFETPPGALYRGVGLPSWSNLVTFKSLRKIKKLDRPAEVLTGVYTDRYYRAAQKDFNELADAPNKDKLNERIRDEMDLANSTAWAFTYYMIERRRQPQLLLRYCQELSALPRDLDLDDRALEACFAKVFDVADPSNPSRIDPAKLAALADAWFAEMAGVSLENPEIEHEYLEVRKLAARKTSGN